MLYPKYQTESTGKFTELITLLFDLSDFILRTDGHCHFLFSGQTDTVNFLLGSNGECVDVSPKGGGKDD